MNRPDISKIRQAPILLRLAPVSWDRFERQPVLSEIGEFVWRFAGLICSVPSWQQDQIQSAKPSSCSSWFNLMVLDLPFWMLFSLFSAK